MPVLLCVISSVRAFKKRFPQGEFCAEVKILNTLYITDLDGTLLDNDKRVPRHAAKTLNSLIADGVKISYATARSFNSAVRRFSGRR